jgi:Anti-sigma-K factor rskA/Putative zinc-finger
VKLREISLPGRKANGREPHTLAGAYAMDAITAPDRVRFESHLAQCEECAQEIAGLHEATARLAGATAVPPPAGLKERVMAAAAMTRQQPPVTAEAESKVRTAGAGPWRRSLAGHRWQVRLAVTAGATAAVVVLAAVVVFGVSDGTMRHQLSQAQSSSQQIAAVLTAHDATMMTGTVTGGGTVTIVMSHARGALVFTAAGLHALPAAHGYELWLIGPAGDRAVGMLPPVGGHMAGPVIASGLHAGDHLALTAEPAGGSSRPDTPMMLDVPL